jgi:hypothetical protein
LLFLSTSTRFFLARKKTQLFICFNQLLEEFNKVKQHLEELKKKTSMDATTSRTKSPAAAVTPTPALSAIPTAVTPSTTKNVNVKPKDKSPAKAVPTVISSSTSVPLKPAAVAAKKPLSAENPIAATAATLPASISSKQSAFSPVRVAAGLASAKPLLVEQTFTAPSSVSPQIAQTNSDAVPERLLPLAVKVNAATSKREVQVRDSSSLRDTESSSSILDPANRKLKKPLTVMISGESSQRQVMESVPIAALTSHQPKVLPLSRVESAPHSMVEQRPNVATQVLVSQAQTSKSLFAKPDQLPSTSYDQMQNQSSHQFFASSNTASKTSNILGQPVSMSFAHAQQQYSSQLQPQQQVSSKFTTLPPPLEGDPSKCPRCGAGRHQVGQTCSKRRLAQNDHRNSVHHQNPVDLQNHGYTDEVHFGRLGGAYGTHMPQSQSLSQSQLSIISHQANPTQHTNVVRHPNTAQHLNKTQHSNLGQHSVVSQPFSVDSQAITQSSHVIQSQQPSQSALSKQPAHSMIAIQPPPVVQQSATVTFSASTTPPTIVRQPTNVTQSYAETHSLPVMQQPVVVQQSEAMEPSVQAQSHKSHVFTSTADSETSRLPAVHVEDDGVDGTPLDMQVCLRP